MKERRRGSGGAKDVVIMIFSGFRSLLFVFALNSSIGTCALKFDLGVDRGMRLY